MLVTTIDGEKVNISKKEFIWAALDIARSGYVVDDKVYISLYPRRDGVFISRKKFVQIIDKLITKFV